MPARSALGLVLALLAAGLAGCLGPDVTPARDVPPLAPLTEPTLAYGEFLAMKVPAHDGARLHVDVQLPDGDGPFPVIVAYTPYSMFGTQNAWGAASERGLGGEDGALGNGVAAYYVPRGYAVAVAHVRGTGESEGCLTVGGPDEGRDGYAIVEALANASWSNGRIALMGTSYVGTTPIATAVLAPPHLATIVPVSAVTEWYRYYFENGEQRVNGDPPPGSSYPDPALWMALGVLPGVRTGATGGARDATCVAEYWAEYWAQDDYDAFWQARNLRKDAANITAPVLYAQGWRDENVATNMIPEFWAAVGSEKRAWFMQHGHGVPAAKKAFHLYVHRWLDHHLLGLENGALDLPAVVVEDNRGKWRTEADWPPADAAPLRFWLAEGGLLAPDAPAEGRASYRDSGAPEHRPERAGVDHLRFESEPLAEDLHVAGVPRANLVARSDATDTQFTVLLYDRAPDGTERLLTRGYLDARHADSLARGKDVTPGADATYAWDLHPRDHVVAAGHVIVAIVKSSDAYVIPDATRATNTIAFGPAGSFLDLPVAPHRSRAYEEEAPEPWGPAPAARGRAV